MRIAIDIQPLQTDGSRDRGVGQYTSSMIEKLIERDRENDYLLLANANLDPPTLKNSAAIVTLPYPKEPYELGELILRVAVTVGRIDVFHVTGNPLEVSDLVMPESNDSFPTRLVWTLYDMIPHLFPETYLQDPYVRKRYCSRLRSLARADRILAISENTKRDAIQHLAVQERAVLNVGAGIKSIYSPLSPVEQEPWVRYLTEKHGIKSKFVMYTGGADWRKNIDAVIGAFATLPPSLTDHQLVLVGKFSESSTRCYLDHARNYRVDNKVIFTGFVSDHELRAFYSLCTLFVFPSLYEGFGLPLVEGMACGAPVMANCSSSLPEVVGDAGVIVEDMGEEKFGNEMARVLLNEPLRTELSKRGIARAKMFTWDIVASKMMEAYRELEPLNLNGFNFTRIYGSVDKKPKLAVFSPVNPIKSGISDYTEELLGYLLDDFQIDLYLDSGYEPSSDMINQRCNWYDHHLYAKHIKEKDYLGTLYQMGNHPYHAYMIGHLLKHGGITTLHDFGLGDLVEWLSSELPMDSPNRLDVFKELKYTLGEEQGWKLFTEMKQSGVEPGALSARGMFFNRRIFDRSVGMVLHSEWAYNLARKTFPDYSSESLKRIPQGVPGYPNPTLDDVKLARRTMGLPENDLVVGIFGIVSPSKRIVSALKAFAEVVKLNSRSTLVLVGELQNDYNEPLDLIQRLGLSENVKLTGHVNLDVFYMYMKACDIILNLRYPSQGETSAALLRALSLGKPVIVSDGDAFSEFSDDVVVKAKYGTDDEKSVTEKLLLLAKSEDLRGRMGEKAHDYIKANHSWSVVAKEYANFIVSIANAPAARMKLAADFVAENLAHYGIAPSATKTINDFARTIRSMSTPFRTDTELKFGRVVS